MLQIMRINAVWGVAWIAAIFCALQVGCVTHARGRWNPPVMAPPNPAAAPQSSCFGVTQCAATLELIEPGNALPIPTTTEPADLPPELPAEGFWRNPNLNVGPQRLPAVEPEAPSPLPNDRTWGESVTPIPRPIPPGPTKSGPIAEIEIKPPPRDDRLMLAESYYAMAMEADRKLDEHAMSFYLDAILGAWDYMQTAPVERDISLQTGRAWIIYHSSLARLIHIAAATGRFEKNIRVRVPEDYGYRVLEIEYAGFAWRADEFDEWNVVGEYQSKYLLHHYKRPGLGVPLVIVRNRRPDDQFLPGKTPFNATAVLRPVDDEFRSDVTIPCPDSETHVERMVGTLQLFNPDEFDDVEFRECQTALAADWTALFAYMLSHPQAELQRSSHRGIGEPAPAGLFMLEPHQPGRIPIVFVHGLLSAPYTWAAMANELYAYPELHKRYEIWAFQYPTDEPFLASAAVLRRQLDCAVRCSDPEGRDPALDNMVVVGHSMGGLIAKLLAAPSGNTLWEHAAFVPIEEVVAPKDVRIRLQQSFFFSATPYVKDVIYIATPHEGSSWARRCLGQTTSLVIEGIEHREQTHQELVNENPAAFREELRRRPPTSIDLLEPDSLILKGIYQLDVAPEVREHSIIGRGWWSIHDGASDGVVPVKSARLPGVDSEVMISATHMHLNKHPGAICEVLRILQVHADQLPWVQPHLVGQCEPK
ncbi:esterase/lipase family protein [Blastopirellula retiformator]|uniref:Alpha/beta hydrolase family protein n=1 Tax=Blastopirellula retiformator TaxID=2527970 RepID=A0A5C5UTF3_9BACT|nr:alpha/beta fold hydrolase [Blastopirellula retiformator]TWT29496.1 Alpha/beta hydrolase family protein [Blastopirellula retiformator]